jgi:hypothetical protein
LHTVKENDFIIVGLYKPYQGGRCGDTSSFPIPICVSMLGQVFAFPQFWA